MDRKAIIEDCLDTFFEVEVDLVGSRNVEKIIEGPVKFVRSEHGSHMDYSQVIFLVAAAVTIIDSIIEKIILLKSNKSSTQTIREIKTTIEVPPQITDDQLESIYVYLQDRLSKELPQLQDTLQNQNDDS